MMDLSASEITNLMTSYLTNTMASVVTADLLKKAEASDVKEMLELGVKIADEEVKGAELFMGRDNRPLPEPFTEKDILRKNSKYYSDNFVILIKYKLGQDALNLYNICFTTAVHPEVIAFYKKMLYMTVELMEQCTGLLIDRGMHQPVIHIPRNEKSEKIHHQAFLGKLFGKNRSLSAPEVLQLTSNYLSTEIYREALSSFRETETKELQAHFDRGIEMCSKQLESIQNMLDKDELPQLPTWESEVDTTSAPFSERLMLFKIALMAGASAGRFGVSASATLRRDVGATFIKLMGETLLFAEDTGNLLIKYNMLDEPPLVKEE